MADATREVGFVLTVKNLATPAIKGVKVGVDTAKKAIKLFGVAGKKALDAIRKAGAGVGKLFKGIGKSLMSLKGLIGGFVAFMAARGLTRFFGESIRLAGIQQQAVEDLGAALSAVGSTDIAGASKRLQELASNLQSVTTFGDETIIAMQALGLRVGLSEEEVAKYSETALNVATVTGRGLRESMILVAKAAKGETGSLGDLNIKIDQTKPAADRAAEAMMRLNSEFGGAARAQATTFAGRMKQLGNTFGDLREILGTVVTNSVLFRAVMAETDKAIQALGESLKDSTEDSENLVTKGFDLVIDAIQVTMKVIGFLAKVFQGLKVVGNAVILGLIEGFRLVRDGIVATLDNFVILAEKVSEFTGVGQDMAKSLREGLDEFGTTGDEAASIFRDSMNDSIDSLMGVDSTVNRANKSLENYRNRVKDTAKTITGDIVPANNSLTESLAQTEKQADETTKALKASFQTILASGQSAIGQFGGALSQFGDTLFGTLIGASKATEEILGAQQRQINTLKDARENDLISAEEYNEGVRAASEGTKKALLGISTAVVSQFMAAGNAMGELMAQVIRGQKTISEAAAQMASAFLMNIITMVEQSILAFAAQAAAAQLAAHAFLPFIGIAVGAAAAATITGLVKALISDVPAGFKEGGEVRGGIPGRDSVHALLTPGEFVFTVEQTKSLKSLMRSLTAPGAGSTPARPGIEGLGMQRGGMVQPQMAMAGGFGQTTVNVQFNSVVPAEAAQRKRAFRMVDKELKLSRARKPFK